jgi:hypothetical protein
MRAEFKPVRELFAKTGARFEVPGYQRGYEWKQKERRDLWLDVQRIGEEVDQHYLGNIILLKTDSAGRVYEIVDGQQRITTLTLLVMAIRDTKPFQNDTEIDRRIEEVISTYPQGDEERRLRLNDQDNDDDLHHIWRRAPDEARGDIRDTYNYFQNRLQGLQEHEVQSLLNNILDRLRVVETTCRDTSLAYTVFQSQNERGKEVSPHVLAKSRIYAAAEDLDNPQAVTKRWEHIYRTLQENLGGSRWGHNDLKIRRPLSQILLHAPTQTPMQIERSELYRKFEQILNSYGDVTDFVGWVDDEVDTYLNLTSNRYDVDGRGLPTKATRWLQYLNSSSNQAEVLSLSIFEKVDETERPDALAEYFRLAAIIGMRMELGGMNATEKPDVLYSAADQVREVDEHTAIRRLLQEIAVNETPEDGEIIEHLKSNQMNYGGPWQFRTLLTLASIEEARRGPLRLELSELHIDHVAPRRIPEDTNYHRWRKQIDEDEFVEKRNLLGNLTLLDPEAHGSLKEEHFDHKRSVYTNSDIRLAEGIADYDKWDIDAIEERTERLAKELNEFWSIN